MTQREPDDSDRRWCSHFRAASLAASRVVIGLGVVVLVGGWWLRSAAPDGIGPALATMKANTAALFVLLGAAIPLAHRGTPAAQRIARGLGLVVAGAAAATLVEYALGADLGIDQLLARDAGALVSPGRMAPETAIDFLLLGVALLLGGEGWRLRVSEAAALLAAITSFAALCGYLYGVRALYTIGVSTSVALHTAAGFALASAALLLGRPRDGITGLLASGTDAGRSLRRLLPAIVLGPIVIGWLRLEGERAGYYGTPFGLALTTLSTVVLLTLFTSLVAARLRRSERGRHRALEELIEANERFRAQLREVVESAPQGIALFDTSMRYIEASQRWMRDYGLTAGVLGRSHYDLFPELPEAWKEVHRRCIAGATEENDGERFVRRDGSVQWVRWKVCPWRDASGAIGGVLIFSEDITDARNAEAERARLLDEVRRLNANLEQLVAERTRELAIAKETLDGIIGIAADAIVTIDEARRITIFNRGAESIFGWTRDEVMGKPVEVLLPERLRDVHEGDVAAFAREPVKSRRMGDRRTVLGRRKGGEEFPAEAAISTLEVGAHSLFTVILRDVTEQQRFAARQAVLVRVGEILEAAAPVDEVAQRIAEAAVPVLGDACEVLVVEDGATRALARRAAPEPSGAIADALDTREAFERRRPLVREGAFVFPLLAHGDCFGALAVRSRAANPDGAAIVEEVARRLAIALDNAFLRERVQLEATITTHLGEGVVLIRTSDGTIVYANPQFERMFGYGPGELLGRHVSVVNAPGVPSPEGRAEEIIAALRRDGTWRGEVHSRRKDGSLFWCHSSVATFEHPRFGPVWIAVHTDVTERRRLEAERARRYEERETLLKEIHHRVKNNLQVIASLFYLQRERTSQESLRKLLDESRNRIQAIALVHEKLYRAEDLAWIDFADYLRSLASTVRGAIGVDASPVAIDVQAGDVVLDIDRAIPCALVVNELVSNALKHAYPAGRAGKVRVGVTRPEPGLVEVEVSDDGVGFPPALDFRTTSTLGMQLVVSLVKQLRGTVELDRTRGTTFRIRFPASARLAA